MRQSYLQHMSHSHKRSSIGAAKSYHGAVYKKTNDGGATCTIREASITEWNKMEQIHSLQMVVGLRVLFTNGGGAACAVHKWRWGDLHDKRKEENRI